MPEHARNASGLGIHKAKTSLKDTPHRLDYIAPFNVVKLFLRYKALHVFSGCIVHENSALGQCCQRRLPWKIIVDKKYMDSPQLSHVLKLAEEKNVPVEEYPLKHYKCCGIIKKLADA